MYRLNSFLRGRNSEPCPYHRSHCKLERLRHHFVLEPIRKLIAPETQRRDANFNVPRNLKNRWKRKRSAFVVWVVCDEGFTKTINRGTDRRELRGWTRDNRSGWPLQPRNAHFNVPRNLKTERKRRKGQKRG